jgi:hypothetical protein
MSSPSVRIDTLTYRLPPDLASKVAASLEDWQAGGRGDFQVLVQRGRRALRVHFAKAVREGLAGLQSAVLE